MVGRPTKSNKRYRNAMPSEGWPKTIEGDFKNMHCTETIEILKDPPKRGGKAIEGCIKNDIESNTGKQRIPNRKSKMIRSTRLNLFFFSGTGQQARPPSKSMSVA